MPESTDTKSTVGPREGCSSASLSLLDAPNSDQTVKQGSTDHIHTKFISLLFNSPPKKTSSKNIALSPVRSPVLYVFS